MSRSSHFVAAALVAACTSFAANAAVVGASFTGVVQAQTASGYALNSPIAGSFTYDTGSASFLTFSVGSYAVAAGHASSAVFTPDLYSAIYIAQLSPVGQVANVNSSFSLDLEAGAVPWSSASAIALLGDAGQLASNLDVPDSFFGFYTGNADGTQVHSANARLTSLTVTAPVPEPATYGLIAAGLGGLLLMRRARATR